MALRLSGTSPKAFPIRYQQKAENVAKFIMAFFFTQIPVPRCLWAGTMACGSCDGWCERLYRDKAGVLILYGRALGLSHAEAEDVVQETFVAILKITAEPEQPERYLLRSFRNRALNHRRSLWRRIAREFESGRWFDPATDESPAERAAMRCLARLPRDQREGIVLKIWHEHTFDEIGELLGLSPNTAAGRYRYGLEKLRACLSCEKTYERTQLEPSGDIPEPYAFLETPVTLRGA